MRIGVLTSGGDCPGLNAVIRSVVHRAVVDHGDEVIGFRDGWKGLLECDYLKLDLDAVSGILARGGTILGSSRVRPEHLRDGVERAKGHVEELGLDAIIPIGGEGTLKAARLLSDNGLPIVGVPKTIDNDIAATDVTFGFDTAVTVATEALDRLTTAPITRDVAVVQLKRALPDPLRRIELFDLVDQAVAQIVGRSTPEHKPVIASSTAWADTFGANVRGYRADSETLLHLLATGVFHDDGTHDHVWQRAVERLARLRDTSPSPFNEYLEKLRHLPALLATWTIGVAAVLSRREKLLGCTTCTRPGTGGSSSTPRAIG